MSVLAIDLGLRTGFAYFVDGELQSYRSTHFPNKATLKNSVWNLLKEYDGLESVVVEGDAALATIWEKVATKQGVFFARVAPETWRADVLTPNEASSSKTAKRAADEHARKLIAESEAPNPTGDLMSDVAEAIMIGWWFVNFHEHSKSDDPIELSDR